MANDNRDALSPGVLFLGGGAAGYATGRWIFARRQDTQGVPAKVATIAAGASSSALPPATSASQKVPASAGPLRYSLAVERWRPLVAELANGLDVEFLLAWIHHESRGQPCATGIPNKETGLFQSYHPDNDRYGATFAELRAACMPGKNTAHRPLTEAERRLQVSTGIALVRACQSLALSALKAVGAKWNLRDRYCMTKLVHALPAYVHRFPRVFTRKHGRPPVSWAEFRSWVRSLSDAEVIAIEDVVRPWASVAQRDRLFGNAEQTGNAVSRARARPASTENTVALRGPAVSDGLTWSASRIPREPGHRDASWWSVKTPAVILSEMRAAKNEVESLGRDIYATFRHRFDAQLTAAEARFLKTYGRKPGVGLEAQDTDYQTVHSWMQPVPTADDLRHLSYQGLFVMQWGEFEREFGHFYAAHSDSWTERMWRGTYDKAVEYRQRTGEWRQRFEKLGGTPTTPPPKPPTEHFLPPGVSMPWKTIAVIGGIAAGALIIPAAIRASKRD